MNKPWYQHLFSRPPRPEPEITAAPPDHGNAEVQFSLGLQYANSPGAAQDFAQAAAWYRKAAAQGHSLAQFNLGTMYAKGQGMPRDEAESVIWFDRAARRGDAGAQFNLGRIHQRASYQGQPEDALESRIEAYKWFHLAAAQGYHGSETGYAGLVPSMTHEDVAAGDERVAAFVAEKSSALPE